MYILSLDIVYYNNQLHNVSTLIWQAWHSGMCSGSVHGGCHGMC